MKFNSNIMQKWLKKNFLILFSIFFLILKQCMFLAAIRFGHDGTSFSGFYFKESVTPVQISFLMLIIVPVCFFKNKAKEIYMIIINIFFSFMCIIDLWVFRATKHFVELRYIFHPDIINPTGETLFQPRLIDCLFIIDIFLIIFLFYRTKKTYINKDRNIKGGIISIIIVMFCICASMRWASSCGQGFDVFWNPSSKIINRGIIGYKITEAYESLKMNSVKPNQEQIEEIENWLIKNKEELPDNEYKGLFKDKNVICLQIEALEQFVIGKKIYNQEITPNINNILSNSLYFDNIYEQNNAGSSIDCDFMVNTSILPLGDKITNVYYPYKEYLTLPNVLKKEGYTTVLTHAEENGEWYWSESGKKQGYDKIWDISQFNVDEKVGYGISDESFYKQFNDKIKELPQPFFSLSPTLSSHGPFDIDEKYKNLELPDKVNENIMGKYFQVINYADRQIGKFISMLDKSGYLDNTVIIIYGDHAGVNKYYKDQLNGLEMEDDWWKVDNLKVPLIIYSKGMEGKEFNINGGISDLYPTIAYLVGVEDTTYKDYIMGKNLLNTNKRGTVTKSGVIGEDIPKDEKELLDKSYGIGRMYIEQEYYKCNK